MDTDGSEDVEERDAFRGVNPLDAEAAPRRGKKRVSASFNFATPLVHT